MFIQQFTLCIFGGTDHSVKRHAFCRRISRVLTSESGTLILSLLQNHV